MERVGLCLNQRNFAVTQWADLDFNSFAYMGDTLLAANETGIYTVSGTNDNGSSIAGSFSFVVDFGSIVSVYSLRIAYETTGNLQLVLTPDDKTGSARTITLTADQTSNQQHQNKFWVGGRMINTFFGRYWKFAFSNVSGADFSIDSIEITLTNRKRAKGNNKWLPVLLSVQGLNTKADPARIGVNLNNDPSPVELSTAVNVTVSDRGRLSMRKGYTITDLTGSYHSLYSYTSNKAVAVKGSSLFLVSYNDSAYTESTLAAVTAGAKMSYLWIKDRLYYNNGYENGYILNDTAYSWPTDTYIGPTTSKQHVGPRLGHLMAYHNGRVVVASDSVLWFSERFYRGLFDPQSGYLMYPERITMIEPVADGLWVSDKNHIYFIQGIELKDFRQIKLANYGAVEGTSVLINAHDLGLKEGQGLGVLFTTEKGICYGASDGQFLNLTANKLDLENNSGNPLHFYEGAGVIYQDKYIVLVR